MNVGKGLSSRLRERVDIEEKDLVPNGAGGRRAPNGRDRWRPLASGVPAEIVALRGGEALNASIERSTQFYRVTIRNRTDLTPEHRLVWNGVVLNIRTAPPSTDRNTIVMTCESGAPS
jgi:head-tail adaptor